MVQKVVKIWIFIVLQDVDLLVVMDVMDQIYAVVAINAVIVAVVQVMVRVLLARLGLPVPQGLKGRLDLRVFKVFKVCRGRLEIRGLKGFKACRGLMA